MQTNKNNPIYITNISDNGSFKMPSKAHEYNICKMTEYNKCYYKSF